MRLRLVVLAVLAALGAHSQPIQTLNTSDPFPPMDMAKLSAITGDKTLNEKLVVLEFWNLSCITCIRAMPKLDSLQKKYGRQLRIILVTDNTREQVTEFANRRKFTWPELTMVTADRYYAGLFPHEGVPFAVLIQNGKVRAQTFGYNINDKSIAALLASDSFALQDKIKKGAFDPATPLWQNKGFRADSGRVVSMMAGRVPEAPGTYLAQSGDSLTVGMRFINWSLLDLFKVAFNRGYSGIFDYANRIRLEDGAGILKRPENEWEWDAWDEKNAVSYEIVVGKRKKSRMFEHMQNDLLNNFPFEARVERQKRSVLLLVRWQGGPPPKAGSGERSLLLLNDSVILHNVPVANLVRVMNQQYQYLLPPVVDETGIAGTIDAVIESGLENIFRLKAALRKIGLDLVNAERECDVLVISKRI